MEDMFGALNLKADQLILIPCNSAQAGKGGDHWALLCFDPSQETKFVYFDSMGRAPMASAVDAAKKLAMLMKLDSDKIDHYR